MAVLNVEHQLTRLVFCARARRLGISAIRKRAELTAGDDPAEVSTEPG
jgi:hypothetical protein